jgi:phage FluMu protein Com
MARISMREVRPGEVPPDGGTAIQEAADRPVFSANGPDDYVCANCGNLLAASMSDVQMTLKVRIKCGRCKTVNVAVTDIKGQPIRIR